MMTRSPVTNETGFAQDRGDPYFQWLCKRVGIPRRMQYFRLAWELHRLIFRPGDTIETDKNRANDGLQLRVIFMQRYSASGSAVNRGPCTMLEFLIGLAGRMSYVMGADDNDLHTRHYFWKMIENLRLIKFSDERYEELNGDFFVSEATDRLLFRTYDSNGDGGLFPLKHPSKDQREVEIWYQMQSWLLESGDVQME